MLPCNDRQRTTITDKGTYRILVRRYIELKFVLFKVLLNFHVIYDVKKFEVLQF